MTQQTEIQFPTAAEIELAYLAGFFDGEGCICVRRNRKPRGLLHGLEINATNTDPRPLHRFVARFCGHLRLQKRQRPEWQAVYHWRISGPRAAAALRAMLPYLIVKGEQATIAIAFQATLRRGGRNRDVSPHVREEREAIVRQLRVLKGRA